MRSKRALTIWFKVMVAFRWSQSSARAISPDDIPAGTAEKARDWAPFAAHHYRFPTRRTRGNTHPAWDITASCVPVYTPKIPMRL